MDTWLGDVIDSVVYRVPQRKARLYMQPQQTAGAGWKASLSMFCLVLSESNGKMAVREVHPYLRGALYFVYVMRMPVIFFVGLVVCHERRAFSRVSLLRVREHANYCTPYMISDVICPLCNSFSIFVVSTSFQSRVACFSSAGKRGCAQYVMGLTRFGQNSV